MSVLKIALIGYGEWAKKIEKHLIVNSKYQIIKIYTSKIGRDIFTYDMNEIAADESIEAVIIASPPETHYYLSKFFLKKNKSVFCEKPLAHSMNQIKELESILSKSSNKLFTDYTFLYSNELSEKILKLKSIQDDTLDIKITMNFSQNGRFYNEHVYFTLTSHLIAILDEIVDIANTDFNIKNEIISNGYVVSASIEFKYMKISGCIETSLINESKIRLIEFSYGNVKEKYDPLSFDESKTFDENQNLSRVLQEFYIIVKENLIDNFDKSYRITNVLNMLIDSIKR